MRKRVPQWLSMLRAARTRVGRPLMEDLAVQCGLPEALLLKIFTGEVVPHRAELAMVIDTLIHASPEGRKILDAYDADAIEPDSDDGTVPAWLQLLRVERAAVGYPSLREIAAKAGLSHGNIGDIFNGKNVAPSLNTLQTLVLGLTQDPVSQEQILTAYEQYKAAEVYGRPSSRALAMASSDAHLIAEAINNLADAIRSLKSGRVGGGGARPCGLPERIAVHGEAPDAGSAADD